MILAVEVDGTDIRRAGAHNEARRRWQGVIDTELNDAGLRVEELGISGVSAVIAQRDDARAAGEAEAEGQNTVSGDDAGRLSQTSEK